ncbi:MAG: GNAT family N-acetyltransferase [Chloroflexi bacterium]|nr:GNAT family N-acetyltransferase [Chloroflexota bacterium]
MDGNDARLLRRLDAIARRLVTRAAPVRFQLAQSPEERAAVFRLRFETVVKQGWAMDADFPEGLERDSFDDQAVLVAGWHDGRLAATARLVFPEPSRPSPIEQEFALSAELPDGVVDLRRAIVAAPYRSRRHTVYAALLARCWLEVRGQGLYRVCGAATPAWLERYRQLGLPVRVLGPPQEYWGEERYPLFLEGVELARALQERRA